MLVLIKLSLNNLSIDEIFIIEFVFSHLLEIDQSIIINL